MDEKRLAAIEADLNKLDSDECVIKVKVVYDLIAAVREQRGEPVAWIRTIRGSSGPYMPDEYEEVVTSVRPRDESQWTALYVAPPTVTDALEKAEKVCYERAAKHRELPMIDGFREANEAERCGDAIAKLREELCG